MAKKKEKAESAPVEDAKPLVEAKPVVSDPKPKKIKNAGRLAPKNKSRLPRKQKKAQAKAKRSA